MNALASPPPFPTNPQPGDVYCGWTWNGSQWICTQGQTVNIQTFGASGSYIPSPGLIALVVECIGGGGASGAVADLDALYAAGSGGGGSGGYSRKALSASLVRGGVIVTIGAGGVGGTGPGGAGGATSFGALCVANGGLGGGGNNTVDQVGEAGLGGPVGVGDFVQPGNDGDKGDTVVGLQTLAQTLASGRGGSLWGGGPTVNKVGPGSSAPGAAGLPNTGAGATGAVSNAVSTPNDVSGSNGGSGICTVTEYCFAVFGGGGGDCGCGPTGGARVAQNYGGWDGND